MWSGNVRTTAHGLTASPDALRVQARDVDFRIRVGPLSLGRG
jgi:hypothetical protein